MKYELNSLIGHITEADCEEVLAQLPDKCVDLVLTDPPYGLNMANLFNAKNGKQYGNAAAPNGFYEAGDWDLSPPSEAVFSELRRVSKNQIVWGGNHIAALLGSSPCWLVWDKRCGVVPEMSYADCEIAFTSFDKPARVFRFIWSGFIQQNMGAAKEERHHPTQKPVPLFKWCLSNYSSEGMLVLDPFSGSGTTALACHALNRRFICIEREHKYVEISRNRLRDAQAQMDLFRSAKTESAEAQNIGTQHGQQEIAEVLAEGEL
jgi:site-specific DNA-methyltransferase (adenine-specific)